MAGSSKSRHREPWQIEADKRDEEYRKEQEIRWESDKWRPRLKWEVEAEKVDEILNKEQELRWEIDKWRPRFEWEVECDRLDAIDRGEMLGEGEGTREVAVEDTEGSEREMMSGSDSGQSDDESKTGRKRRRKSSESDHERREKQYVVGMTAGVRQDGVLVTRGR